MINLWGAGRKKHKRLKLRWELHHSTVQCLLIVAKSGRKNFEERKKCHSEAPLREPSAWIWKVGRDFGNNLEVGFGLKLGKFQSKKLKVKFSQTAWNQINKSTSNRMLPRSNPVDSFPIPHSLNLKFKSPSFDSQSTLTIDFKTASISEAIKYFIDARMNELKVSFITLEIDIAESTSQAAQIE